MTDQTKYIVLYLQYGNRFFSSWTATTPFSTRELAQRHVDSHLRTRETLINGEPCIMQDKSYITEIRLLKVDIDSLEKLDNSSIKTR